MGVAHRDPLVPDGTTRSVDRLASGASVLVGARRRSSALVGAQNGGSPPARQAHRARVMAASSRSSPISTSSVTRG